MIQRDIEDAISEKILMGELEDGQRVVVDSEGEGILGEFTFCGEQFDDAKPRTSRLRSRQRRSQLTSRLTTPLPPRRRPDRVPVDR